MEQTQPITGARRQLDDALRLHGVAVELAHLAYRQSWDNLGVIARIKCRQAALVAFRHLLEDADRFARDRAAQTVNDQFSIVWTDTTDRPVTAAQILNDAAASEDDDQQDAATRLARRLSELAIDRYWMTLAGHGGGLDAYLARQKETR